jgi:hypothetical protein
MAKFLCEPICYKKNYARGKRVLAPTVTYRWQSPMSLTLTFFFFLVIFMLQMQ